MLISFTELKEKYNLKIKGIIHIGANNFEEYFEYWTNGIRNIVAVEPCTPAFSKLLQQFASNPNVKLFKVALSNKKGFADMFVETKNNGQSNSLLKPKLHTEQYKDITFDDKETVAVELLDELPIDRAMYNMVNIDVQGKEGDVFLGGLETLKGIDYIYSEINRAELYENCTMVEDLDKILTDFVRVETNWGGGTWGDALYIRKSILDGIKVVNVPKIFAVPDAHEYPKWNTPDFEYWLSQNINDSDITSDRIYLPVLFTAYHKRYSYGQNKAAIDNLQNYINGLDKSKKYFTVVQYDDGTLIDWSGLDIMIFTMSGEPNKEDYPMPLICQPFKTRFNTEKKYLANFVGRITHPLRTKMIAALNYKQGYYISTYKHVESDYHQILAESTFSLCPRGYGKNSFRIMESIYQGSIPVYISDEFILPHNIDFEKYGVIIKESDIDNIDEILRAIPEREVKSKQAELQKTFDVIYSFEANKKYILNIVN
jgi:FkbM family methyltransferase